MNAGAVESEPASRHSADRPPPASCLYECEIMHQRLAPKKHEFRYRIFMFCLDLDELDSLTRKLTLFSHNRSNIYEFRDRDHLTIPGGERQSLKENLIGWLAQQGIQFPAEGRIKLITLPRVFGYIFNPVSFYFCSDENGAPLCAVVQVGNTFREMKPYLITDLRGSHLFHRQVAKHFYVSPFSGLDVAFDFKLKIPDEHLDIHIDDRDGEDRILLSALTGRRKELSNANLFWFTLKYPLITLRVIGLIHWQALVLWSKRLPWHSKSAQPDRQQNVYRPHANLSGKSSHE
ncbi:MAG: DUF1365 domain-containing protein [Chthoniobacteraceae bacterium]